MMDQVIAGVKISKVDKPHLVASAAKILKKDRDTVGKMGTEAIIAALANQFATLPPKSLITCDICGGDSDEGLDSCPYCLEETAAAQDATKIPAERPSTRKVVADRPSSKVLKEKAKEPTGPALVKAKYKATPATALARITEAVVGLKEVETIFTDYHSIEPVPKTENGLNIAIARTRALGAGGAISWWRIGDYIRKTIYETELWTQRKGPDGKPIYKSFEQFVPAELGMSANWCFRVIKVAKEFSEEQAIRYGQSCLRLIAALEDHERKLLLKQIDDGKIAGDARGIEKAAKALRKVRGKKEEAKLKALSAAAPKIRHTFQLEKDRYTVPAYIKGEEKLAKRLADRPTMILKGTNHTELRVTLAENAKGELVFQVSYKRDE